MSSELLLGLGMLLVSACACAGMLMAPGRARWLVMTLALALLPALILADQWDTPRIVALRESPVTLIGGGFVALAAVAALAGIFRRWPMVMPLALIAAMPFRVPLQTGGEQANLLVPLYLVLAGAVVASAFVSPQGVRFGAPAGPAADQGRAARWLGYLLPATVALYAMQAIYSVDTSAALQDICFFLVPFSFALVLLREQKWSPRLLFGLVWVLCAEALCFTLFGFGEYLTRHLIWNPEVIRANEFHVYFRVNSLFWDPNMFGRFLVLVILALTTLLLWAETQRRALILTGLIGVLWLGLALTYSLSSFAALLAGLAVLAALRWSRKWTVTAVCTCLAALLVLLAMGSDLFEEETKLNNRTSGRGDLITGGVELFGQRPLAGFGSASFSAVFLDEIADGRAPVSESHTEPITVAVEQGVVGLVLYFALIAAAFATMAAGLGRIAPGIDGGSDRPGPVGLARMAVLAAFVALLVHTLSYAGFLEDPVTWLLLALASALSAAFMAGRRAPVPEAEPGGTGG